MVMEAEAQRCELTCLRSHSLGRREPECLRNLGGALQMQSGFELGNSKITGSFKASGRNLAAGSAVRTRGSGCKRKCCWKHWLISLQYCGFCCPLTRSATSTHVSPHPEPPSPLHGCGRTGWVGGEGGRCSHLAFSPTAPAGVGVGNKLEELKSPFGRK